MRRCAICNKLWFDRKRLICTIGIVILHDKYIDFDKCI